MIERIFKNIKYIGLGVFTLDLLFAVLTVIYYALTLKGIMQFGLWFVIVTVVAIVINIIFAIGLLLIKKIRKY